ncbi:MAG: transcription elongation factor GreA [Verrucomicrobiota bacterium JB022]|nr:transcription elongation factor GreA [Verrucomicrobiota bacterium JB022]
MDKEAIDQLIKNSPRLKRYRSKLEAMRPGAYVVHRSWGLGQIQEYDVQDNKLIIDFEEGKKGHPMDPEFCADKLDVLPTQDILVRSREEPARINQLIKSEPADLIVEILTQTETHSATNLELETILSRLLGPTKYKKWWTATKKVLIRDPRVAVPSKKTDPYILRDEPVRAEEEVLEEFFETKAPKKKITLASRLIELSVNHEDIADSLPDILKELTASLAETKQLNPGERLYGIWIRNDLARFIHEDVEQLEPTSATVLEESINLSELAEQIPATHYKRYLDLITRVLPDEWERVVFELLKNSSGKFTSECINFLLERDLEDELAATMRRWLVEQNLKAPVLAWVLKNRNSRKYANMLDGLMGPRLLSAIFFAIDYEALQNTGTRRIPLADLVIEDSDLIADLLNTATPETAHDLAQTLILNQGFEDLSKKSLLARFIKLFPSVQALVSGESAEVAEESTSAAEGLIVSKWSFETQKREYEDLVQNQIPRNKVDIAEARAHGDLRENAEYKMARQEQDILLTRKTELELAINRCKVTDFSDAPKDRVGIGSVVGLRNLQSGEAVTYTILGAWDGNPEKHVLSYQTPLAKALIAKTTGEHIKVKVGDNEDEYEVQSIERWCDLQKSGVSA